MCGGSRAALWNSEWFEMFPHVKNFHLDREWSDHAPIKVALEGRISEYEGRRKMFRFEQIWVGENGCEETVSSAWDNGGEDLLSSLGRCAKELQAWKGLSIGKVLRDLHKKRRQLKRLNEGGRTAAVISERKRVVADFVLLLKQEKLYWRQRSHDLWLKDGDRNTKFFHRKAGQRKQKNLITKIIDDDGVIREGNRHVERVATKYFRDLFKTSNPTNFEDVLDGVAGRVTREMNSILTKEYTENQSAFTLGWLITDNILVAFVIFHHMKNNRSKGRYMAMALDMSKAYDRVEWIFLEIIQPKRGMRQEDPLSTYLFILCAEVISSLIRNAVFADDSSHFVKAKINEAENVKQLLMKYVMASEQRVNYDKTTISFSRRVSLEVNRDWRVVLVCALLRIMTNIWDYQWWSDDQKR
ncbi:hypothetical protein RND81_02G183500 [Saponaria officinalis]|uniref:Reverse transcriptase n=1 Tax=Saponaria officinalis TaxID=3572 RepID=A0AAW1MMM0_SAPOF